MTGRPARHDALDVVHQALRGLDQRDWTRYRAAFADRLHLDYSSWRPDSIGWWSADDWVARVSSGFISDCDATQHCVTNPVLTDDGDDLLLDVELRAMHIASIAGATEWLELGGHYTWRFTAVEGRWCADGLTLDIRWRLGNPDLPALAAARDPG